MDWLSKALVRLFGVEPKDEVASAFTAEEVAHILDESRDEGLVGREHYERLGAALEFSDKDAADVGVPLAGLVTVTSAATPLDIERLVAKHGFSRYPVVDDAGRPRRLPAPQGRALRRRGRAPRAGAGQAGAADGATCAAATRSSRCCRPCRSPARTWPASSPTTATVVGVVFLEDVIEELVGEVSDSSQR